jgi:hypothetical protein
MGRASLPAAPQATGSRRLSRVPRTTIRTFNAHIRRRVHQRPLLEQERSPWPSPCADGLGSLIDPPTAGPLNDACSGFTRVADRTIDPAPLRTRPLDHARGLHYRGPRRLPGPDSHRQAALNLSPLRHVELPFFMAPRQSRRTRAKRGRVATRRDSRGAANAGPAGDSEAIRASPTLSGVRRLTRR